MRIKREGVPEEGDIVVAVVTKVAPHAAFFDLEEYSGVKGLVHISEVSKTWVKNIKSQLRNNQSVVCKVLDIKKKDDFVHLSMRRVNDHDRRAKWDQVRRNRRIENLIELAAKKTKRKFGDIYKSLKPFEEKYGEIYFAFEEAKKEGREFFKSMPELKDVLWEIVDKNIALPEVEIVGTLEIRSSAVNGLERIQKILSGVEAQVTYISAPRYRLSVKAVDYKEAERKLDSVIKSLEKKLKKTDTLSFEREKKK